MVKGGYYAEDDVLDELEANGQIVFRYCDEKGNIEPMSNPNGAMQKYCRYQQQGK